MIDSHSIRVDRLHGRVWKSSLRQAYLYPLVKLDELCELGALYVWCGAAAGGPYDCCGGGPYDCCGASYD